MRNKVLAFCRENGLFDPGDRVICAVSGGMDSMAMLWCLWSLRDKLKISVSAAHFNHKLRGAESDGDAAFVRDFCRGFGIDCAFGSGEIHPGKKGLEAAAREARYDFLLGLDPEAKIATAHTAGDNGETILMHLLRGAGLKGLGGIPPKRGQIVRPMLCVTREEISAYLEEFGIPHREDSSNFEDDFLRNRLRHQVMPILLRENPAFLENITPGALRLRQDEDYLAEAAQRAYAEAKRPDGLDCRILRALHPAMLGRVLSRFLQECGLKEPGSAQIEEVKKLVFSENPSAHLGLSGGRMFSRRYDLLRAEKANGAGFEPRHLAVPGVTEIPELGLRVTCREEIAPPTPKSTSWEFLLDLAALPGRLLLRPRAAGDCLTRPGGTKTVKKLLIDRKIPADERSRIPVLESDGNILGVFGLGPDIQYLSKPGEKTLRICITKIKKEVDGDA